MLCLTASVHAHACASDSQNPSPPPPQPEWILISTRDHHRSPLRSVTGDPLEVSQTPEMGGSVGHLRNKWTSISTRDHHRSPLQGSIISLHRLLGPVDDYAGDGLEYNLSTCILAHLATPPPGYMPLSHVLCPKYERRQRPRNLKEFRIGESQGNLSHDIRRGRQSPP